MKAVIATRRKFLSFLGGAVAAGPSTVKSAAQMTAADLGTQSVGLVADQFGSMNPAMGASDNVGYAKKFLNKLKKMTPMERERRLKNTHVHSLDADIAVLRSVSIGTKIRMSRRVQFRMNEESERTYWEGVINGWWN